MDTPKTQLEKTYVPYGVTSFAQLDSISTAINLKEAYYDLLIQFIELSQNIIDTGSYQFSFDVEYGPAAQLENLAKEFISRLRSVVNKDYTPVVEKENVCLYKNFEGDLVWIGIHTNKYEDRSKDILTEASHKKFVERLEKGEVEYPEFWIWHIEDPVGTTELVSYDDRGFMVSGGKVFPQYEELVTNLVKNTPEMGMSHGMPKIHLKYDNEGHIVEYITKEISFLPVERADNLLTYFITE